MCPSPPIWWIPKSQGKPACGYCGYHASDGKWRCAVIDNCRKAVYGYDQRAEVFGSEGWRPSAATASQRTRSAKFGRRDGRKASVFLPGKIHGCLWQGNRSFIDAIVNDTKPLTGVMDGLKPVLMGLAAKILGENTDC